MCIWSRALQVITAHPLTGEGRLLVKHPILVFKTKLLFSGDVIMGRLGERSSVPMQGRERVPDACYVVQLFIGLHQVNPGS